MHDVFGSKCKHGGREVANPVSLAPIHLNFSLEIIHLIPINVIRVRNANYGEKNKLKRLCRY